MSIRFDCECGQTLEADDNAAGLTAQCPMCGRDLMIPVAAMAAPERRGCPECGAELSPEAVLCIRCGLDLRTGKKLPGVEMMEGTRPPVQARKPPTEDKLEEAKPGQMMPDFAQAFCYPFRGAALWMVLGMPFVALGCRFVPLGGIIYIAIFYSCLIDILRSAASGPRFRPEPPDFSDFWDSMLFPGLRIAVVGFIVVIIPLALAATVTVGTAAALLNAAGKPGELETLFAGSGVMAVVGLVCASYYPMTLTIVGIYDSLLGGLNPRVVFRSISRIPGEYAVVCLFTWAVLAAGYGGAFLVKGAIPIAGSFIGEAIRFYFIAVAVSRLGFMAYRNKARMGW